MSDAVYRAKVEAAYILAAEISKSKQLGARIEQLEAECFKLAAYQCNHGYGDEYGHFRCARIEQLEAALREAADLSALIQTITRAALAQSSPPKAST